MKVLFWEKQKKEIYIHTKISLVCFWFSCTLTLRILFSWFLFHSLMSRFMCLTWYPTNTDFCTCKKIIPFVYIKSIKQHQVYWLNNVQYQTSFLSQQYCCSFSKFQYKRRVSYLLLIQKSILSLYFYNILFNFFQ